jgi:YesN/AraC family two-component response regulator
MNLLIVDDERMTRESLAEHIDWESLGFDTVQTAANGLVALEICAVTTPDIILCDIMMPKMDGIAFCKKLRDDGVECGIIFLSGYPDKENLKKALRIQALDFLEKPLKIDEVIETVKQAISRQASRPKTPDLPEKPLSKIEEIKSYIHANIGDTGLTVGKVAAHFYLSPNYFGAFFKRRTGITINDYITDCRIEQSKKFLLYWELKLYEIASMVGFSDPDYFATVFRNHTGVLPSQFRERQETGV